MKKTLTIASFAILLSACASNTTTNTQATTAPNTGTKPTVYSFTCEDSGMVTATYDNDAQTANLTMSLPNVGLNDRQITMDHAVSASGARYVNDMNPETTYDWHTKGTDGILTIASDNGQEYQVTCHI
ncbi:MAG: MliC family protein [Psychrobacter sp.]